MKDKDKLFLIVYFGVKNKPVGPMTSQMLIGFYNNLKSTLDDSIKCYVVPQPTTDEIHMELLNVETCSDEKIERIEKLYQFVVNEFNKDK